MAKSAWLQEVEDDATRIQTRRFNEYFEDQQLKAEKAEREKEKSFGQRMAEVKAAKKANVVEVEEPQVVQKGKK